MLVGTLDLLVLRTLVFGPAHGHTIAQAIEHGEIVIDKLSLAVKRADFLNRHLEKQLVSIEEDLKQLGQQGKSPQ